MMIDWWLSLQIRLERIYIIFELEIKIPVNPISQKLRSHALDDV